MAYCASKPRRTDALDMRTRTFIGMIILILALIVASTPALLDLTSNGVQTALHKAGVPGVPAANSGATAPSSSAPAKDKLTAQLEIKGYIANKNNLRDEYSTAQRAAIDTYRLSTGARRQLLPGQFKDASATSAPIPLSASGVLLDSNGCPEFADGAVSTAVLADPKVQQLYANAIASADNPATCTVTFTARTAAADPVKVAAAATGRTATDMRRYSATNAEALDNISAVILLREWNLENIFYSTPIAPGTTLKQNVIVH
jgi:hypothetical protein